MNRQLHTPEGVRDITGRECEKKHIIDRTLKETIQSYGYEQLETPTFEFFDTFSRETGTTPSRDLYKFFDREGNTLVLRPDVTPSVARAYANYFSDESPVRLFYSGNVYINHSSLQGRLKETTQIGAECIGDTSVDADAELVAMAIRSLLATGLKDFTVSIGHINFLKGLIDAYHFSAEEEDAVYDLIINKNFFGLEELLSQKSVDDELLQLYTSIGRLFDSPEQLAELAGLAEGYPLIAETFDYFKRLYELLCVYGVEQYVSFELGLVSKYRYYTGILFFGYTYGSGEAILSGGRYDGLLSYFGCDRPAIGFAILSDQLSIALERQGVDVPLPQNRRVYLYADIKRTDAIRQAEADRKDGMRVSLYALPDEEDERQKLMDRLEKSGTEAIVLS